MSTLRDEVVRLVDQGYRTAEIKAAVPGLSPSTVGQYVQQYRSTLSPEQKAEIDELRRLRPATGSSVYQQPYSEAGPISALAQRIGLLLSRYRNTQGLSCDEFATRFGLGNRMRISMMERGRVDLTLTEIERISEITGHSMEHLLNVTKKQQDQYTKLYKEGEG